MLAAVCLVGELQSAVRAAIRGEFRRHVSLFMNGCTLQPNITDQKQYDLQRKSLIAHVQRYF